ncbi:MAG: PQQ-binding-like beta-propeller repeat protein, partial [Bryobacteraceae bacterium]
MKAQRTPRFLLFLLLCAIPACAWAADGDWPRWRGPGDDGMARGDAPLKWSDTERIAWKAPVPGRGFSSPVVWGDRIFVTTAAPAADAPAKPASTPAPGPPGRSGGLVEHKFLLLAYDRKTGKLLWEQAPKTATPHQGHHAQ